MFASLFFLFYFGDQGELILASICLMPHPLHGEDAAATSRWSVTIIKQNSRLCARNGRSLRPSNRFHESAAAAEAEDYPSNSGMCCYLSQRLQLN
jgi:hypothetical protein